MRNAGRFTAARVSFGLSALPRFSEFGAGLDGASMSADEFLALSETQERYELIEGAVARLTRPTPRHQTIMSKLIFQLEGYIERNGGAYFPEVD